MLSIIVAIARNFAIGKNNELLCHLPDDLKRFRKITTGHKIIMGRMTYLSLPVRPLRDRENIVLTDDHSESFEGCTVVHNLNEALSRCSNDEECFIIGGASVYSQTLRLAERLYITWLHRDFDGDVFFPDIDFKEWKLVSEEVIPQTDTRGFSYSYAIYDKVV